MALLDDWLGNMKQSAQTALGPLMPFVGPADAAVTGGYNAGAASLANAGGLIASGMGANPQDAAAGASRLTQHLSIQPRTSRGAAVLQGLLDTAHTVGANADSFAGNLLGVKPSAIASNVERSYPNASAVVGMAAQAAPLAAPAGGLMRAGLLGEMGPLTAGAAPGSLGASLSGGDQLGAVGYHGTPHTLPPTERNPLGEFDLAKVGTGEGAQAYGHGIYVAESPDVAGIYQKSLAYKAFDVGPEAEKRGFTLNSKGRAEVIRQTNDNPSLSSAQVANRIQAANAASRDIPQEKLAAFIDDYRANGNGNLYHVDIPDHHIDKMLNWDAPLSEQPDTLQKMIDAGILKPAAAPFEDRYVTQKGILLDPKDATGGSLVTNQTNDKALSDALHKAGIPGIKYFDGGSRNVGDTLYSIKSDSGGFSSTKYNTQQEAQKHLDGYRNVFPDATIQEHPTSRTRNFVLFDPSIAKITARNGQAADLLGGAAGGAVDSAPLGAMIGGGNQRGAVGQQTVTPYR